MSKSALVLTLFISWALLLLVVMEIALPSRSHRPRSVQRVQARQFQRLPLHAAACPSTCELPREPPAFWGSPVGCSCDGPNRSHRSIGPLVARRSHRAVKHPSCINKRHRGQCSFHRVRDADRDSPLLGLRASQLVQASLVPCAPTLPSSGRPSDKLLLPGSPLMSKV